MGLPRHGRQGAELALSGSLFAAASGGNLPAGGIHPLSRDSRLTGCSTVQECKANSIPRMSFQRQLALAPLYAY